MVAAVERGMAGRGNKEEKTRRRKKTRKKMFLLKFMFLLNIDFFISFCQSRLILVILNLFDLGNNLGKRTKEYFC